MDMFIILIFVIAFIMLLSGFGCPSKRYKCERCGHCFNDTNEVGYDYSKEVCPKCGSSDITWQQKPK